MRGMSADVPRYPVSVKALLYHNGKFLFLLKKRKELPEIYYGLPGGLKEPGESLEEALKREVKEEVGVDIEILDILAAYTYVHPLGNEAISMLYLARPLSLNFKLSGEPDEEFIGVKWLSPDELDVLWPEDYKKVIEGAVRKALSLVVEGPR